MLSEEQLHRALVAGIPLHTFFELQVRRDGDGIVVELPDRPMWRNHVDGQSGGAQFTLSEAAMAACIFDTFADDLDLVFAIPAEATIAFKRHARGPLAARGRVETARTRALADLGRAGEASVHAVAAVLDASGRLVSRGTARWHLSPRRPGSPPSLPGGRGATGFGA